MKKIIAAAVALALVAAALLITAAVKRERQAAAAAQITADDVSEEGTDLDVYFFDAGKADAILMTTENATVLIDCGVKGFGQTILDRLSEMEIDHIDYLIVTHFDQDHVGGAAKVINNIRVDHVLQSNCPKDSTEYEKYLKALRNAAIEAVTVTETMQFTLDGVLFTVDAPDTTNYKSDKSNNASLVVSVHNGANALLFTGDAQTERIEELLESGLATYDFLKVPHHGGDEPLLEQLLAAVQPQYAVITSSDSEPESEATVAALEQSGVQTYLTREGAVTLHSDGTTITVTQ